MPYYLALLAEALTRGGAREAALSALAEARAVAENTGERWYEADLHRLTGVLALQEGALRAAADSFQRALDIARRQQARSLELRAAISLARLWAGQGERQQAYDLLVQVYDGFTEGFDTADLTDARALLDEFKGLLLAWDTVGGGAPSRPKPPALPAGGPTSGRRPRDARAAVGGGPARSPGLARAPGSDRRRPRSRGDAR